MKSSASDNKWILCILISMGLITYLVIYVLVPYGDAKKKDAKISSVAGIIESCSFSQHGKYYHHKAKLKLSIKGVDLYKLFSTDSQVDVNYMIRVRKICNSKLPVTIFYLHPIWGVGRFILDKIVLPDGSVINRIK